ncbi:unnamed protein product [Vitrella brassicaformis CCMP3155]|uniref:Casein kinase I n=2 Tax=Vitrella brassicaformis TaxID=1169539 RepID=A0A0G4EN88_VITBC|nr:unnamed protein product [Vitrella brassicaformis CCMP3155]|eukprot:CEL98462.1 unnamed protein product [Vitrella brassicaformis CCMP3155]
MGELYSQELINDSILEAPPDEEEPVLHGRYRIMRQIDRASSVFAAYDERNDGCGESFVAIKCAQGGSEGGCGADDALAHEAECMVALEGCVGILKVHGFYQRSEQGGCASVVMELGGPSLSLVCAARERLSIPTTMRLGCMVLDTLKSVHDRGLIHRDVKPGHLVMGRGASRDSVHLIDFRSAKDYTDTDRCVSRRREKRPPPFHGAPKYCSIAAHQLEALTRIDDLWSLLFLLAELMLGTLPWQRYHDDDKFCIMADKKLFLVNAIRRLQRPARREDSTDTHHHGHAHVPPPLFASTAHHHTTARDLRPLSLPASDIPNALPIELLEWVPLLEADDAEGGSSSSSASSVDAAAARRPPYAKLRALLERALARYGDFTSRVSVADELCGDVGQRTTKDLVPIHSKEGVCSGDVLIVESPLRRPRSIRSFLAALTRLSEDEQTVVLEGWRRYFDELSVLRGEEPPYADVEDDIVKVAYCLYDVGVPMDVSPHLIDPNTGRHMCLTALVAPELCTPECQALLVHPRVPLDPAHRAKLCPTYLAIGECSDPDCQALHWSPAVPTPSTAPTPTPTPTPMPIPPHDQPPPPPPQQRQQQQQQGERLEEDEEEEDDSRGGSPTPSVSSVPSLPSVPGVPPRSPLLFNDGPVSPSKKRPAASGGGMGRGTPENKRPRLPSGAAKIPGLSILFSSRGAVYM